MVDGRLSKGRGRTRRCDAADTAINAACIRCGISPDDASECELVSEGDAACAVCPLSRLGGKAGGGALSASSARGESPPPNPPPQAGEGMEASPQSLPCQLRPRAERRQLRFRD